MHCIHQITFVTKRLKVAFNCRLTIIMSNILEEVRVVFFANSVCERENNWQLSHKLYVNNHNQLRCQRRLCTVTTV